MYKDGIDNRIKKGGGVHALPGVNVTVLQFWTLIVPYRLEQRNLLHIGWERKDVFCKVYDALSHFTIMIKRRKICRLQTLRATRVSKEIYSFEKKKKMLKWRNFMQ